MIGIAATLAVGVYFWNYHPPHQSSGQVWRALGNPLALVNYVVTYFAATWNGLLPFTAFRGGYDCENSDGGCSAGGGWGIAQKPLAHAGGSGCRTSVYYFRGVHDERGARQLWRRAGRGKPLPVCGSDVLGGRWVLW